MLLARVAALASVAGFLFGYDLGLIGGAMHGIREEFQLEGDTTVEAIVGAAKFGAFFGTFLGGALMLRYGRRAAIALQGAFFVLGPVVMSVARGPGALVVGRLIIGLGIGASAIAVPAYLGEIAPARSRGGVVQAYELMLTFGMLASVLVDAALTAAGAANAWRWMVGLPAAPGAMMAVAALALPESPRWLVLRGELDRALGILHRITSGGQAMGSADAAAAATAAAEDELLTLWSAVEKDKAAVLERRTQLIARRGGGGGGGGSSSPARGRGWAAAGPGGSSSNSPARGLGRAAAAAAAKVAGALGGGARHGGGGGPPVGVGIDGGEGSGSDGGMGGEGRLLAGYTVDSSGSVLKPDSSCNSAAAAAAGGWWVPSLGARRGRVSCSGGSAGAAWGPPHGAACSASLQSNAPPDFGAEPGRERTVVHTLWFMLADVVAVARGPERRALGVAAGLAFFDQANASTAIINYMPVILETRLGVPPTRATLLPAFIAVTKVIGVAVALVAVDRAGRRPLLIGGGVASAVALLGAAGAAAAGSVPGFLASLCLFIFSFSISWAGLYFVVVSEIFSMAVKSPASSFATSLLFLTGAAVNFIFLSLVTHLGVWATFAVFATIAAAGAGFVAVALPETAGRTLAEVQELMRPGQRGGSGGSGPFSQLSRGDGSGGSNEGPVWSGGGLAGGSGGLQGTVQLHVVSGNTAAAAAAAAAGAGVAFDQNGMRPPPPAAANKQPSVFSLGDDDESPIVAKTAPPLQQQ